MAQLFPPFTNALARGTIFGGLLLLGAIVWAGNQWLRSPYATQVDVIRDQPVPFSHDHHFSGLGIDCRYCHATVETAAFAGMPSTETCMGCHSLIWRDSPLLAPVRESWRTKKPLVWTRVHDLPDFVYFNHSIHVAKGIGCESCHGRVDQMPLMRRAASLHMEWCLDCHEHPDRQLRERSQLFAFGRKEPEQVPAAANKRTDTSARPPSLVVAEPVRNTSPLAAEYRVASEGLMDCVKCHR
jgi:hypothetical protein